MKVASAFRAAVFGLCLSTLGACASKNPPPLYLWESFPKMQYATLTDAGVPVDEQVATLRAQAEEARATGAALPPGFRAHLGLLELNAGDVDEARRLWRAEKSAFPESTPYMDQLLKRLEAPAKKAGAA